MVKTTNVYYYYISLASAIIQWTQGTGCPVRGARVPASGAAIFVRPLASRLPVRTLRVTQPLADGAAKMADK